MPVTDVVIHHNPDCGTSRNVVRIVEAAGYEPVVVEYLKTGWTKAQLQALFAAAGIKPRDALRVKKSPAAELGLTDPAVSDDAILEAMVAHPILVERPIVVTSKGVALCRPSEKVLDLIDRWPAGPFAKEDGELVIDADGKRVG
jgi:arsenate reductase